MPRCYICKTTNPYAFSERGAVKNICRSCHSARNRATDAMHRYAEELELATGETPPPSTRHESQRRDEKARRLAIGHLNAIAKNTEDYNMLLKRYKRQRKTLLMRYMRKRRKEAYDRVRKDVPPLRYFIQKEIERAKANDSRNTNHQTVEQDRACSDIHQKRTTQETLHYPA